MKRIIFYISFSLLSFLLNGQNSCELLLKEADKNYIDNKYDLALEHLKKYELCNISNRNKKYTELLLKKIKQNTLFEYFPNNGIPNNQNKFSSTYKLNKENDSNLFHYVDREGKEIKKLGRWKKAGEFNHLGLATVQKDNKVFLIDTLGKIYPLAFSVDQLTPETTALNISFKNSIPEEVWKYKQLKVLILNQNDIYRLPKEIGQLNNLLYLDLDNNHISYLPDEIGQLKNLVALSLRNNQGYGISNEIGKLKNLVILLYRNLLFLPTSGN